jgi:hypothetical protein
MKIFPTLLIIALVGSLAVTVAVTSNICGKTKTEHEGMYCFVKGKNDGAKVCSFNQSFCMIHMCIIITL